MRVHVKGSFGACGSQLTDVFRRGRRQTEVAIDERKGAARVSAGFQRKSGDVKGEASGGGGVRGELGFLVRLGFEEDDEW